MITPQSIRGYFLNGPLSSAQLSDLTGKSQPTISRLLTRMRDDVVRFGSGSSIHYAIRDRSRDIPDTPVYRVDVEGRLRRLGILIPVAPHGFVMHQEDDVRFHHEGLPWWLHDMRPQGFLGRAYACEFAGRYGLPTDPRKWSDTEVLRILLQHIEDPIGNLLLGDRARNAYVDRPEPHAVRESERGETYVRLAATATRWGLQGSSAGGEQPKFTAYVETPNGPRHVLVKFSIAENNPVAGRWRDLLLTEHVAAETWRAAGFDAVTTRLLDHAGQRFLEIERFDRVGARGRHALVSLEALDSEFVGMGSGPWPEAVGRLADDGHVQAQARQDAALLYAFGTLIGNTDMHFGNLSFLGDHGRPDRLSPAYDMLPMGFAPRSSGDLPEALPDPHMHASVDSQHWLTALEIARDYLCRLQVIQRQGRFSERFCACLNALERHLNVAAGKMERLG